MSNGHGVFEAIIASFILFDYFNKRNKCERKHGREVTAPSSSSLVL